MQRSAVLPSLALPLALFLGLAGAAGGAAAGAVTVSFVDAPRYADAGATPGEREATLAALARHLSALGRDRLPADQSLAIEILDVDLAGSVWPSAHAGRDLRVLRGGADAPRIALRYTLEVPGQPARSGRDSVADLDYLRGLANARADDPLRYEKRLLDRWFGSLVAPRRTAPD